VNKLENPRIQVQDTKGTSFAIQFDHWDVGGEEWVEVFKLILTFLGFAPQTINDVFSVEEE